jgi:two-component system alkaline phosphatase synthesis response regulator PhoP
MMSNIKVLIVDDEPTIVNTVRVYLEAEGYIVYTARDGLGALKAERSYHPDLVILDIMMPGIDGIEVLRRIRQESDVYVLMLTSRIDETDKVIGLSMGADDYLAKPFSPRELAARVKAILRRGRNPDPSDLHLVFRRLRIDNRAHKVWKDEVQVELTPTEFELLVALAKHAGWVLSREQLIENIWGGDYYGDERLIDVHIGRLRKKIEDDPANPLLLVTARASGYRFEDETL